MLQQTLTPRILQHLSKELTIPLKGLVATIELLDQDATVPFIARYRKEVTGNLDEVQIRAIEEKLLYFRELQDRKALTFGFDADFQVESYLRHQGSIFVERFDANSYLYITRAMDYFDLAADYGGVLANAFRGAKTRICVVSFTSDWLFPTSDARQIVHALNAAGASVSFAEIVTDKGHDAFLLEEPELFQIVRGFLEAAARARGLKAKG